METIKTHSIVLKSISYSESSIIVKIYTRELGLISCLVKGAKRKNAKINNHYLQNLSLLDIVVCKHNFSDLYYISDIYPSYIYKNINNYPVDIVKNCIFLFINDFLVKCLKEGVHSTDLFDYIYFSLKELDSQEHISPEFHIIFLVHIAKLIGFAFPKPKSDHYNYYDIEYNIWTQIRPLHSNFIPSTYVNHIITAIDLEVNEHIYGCTNSSIRKSITEFLIKYYQYHIPEIGQITSLEMLSAIIE